MRSVEVIEAARLPAGSASTPAAPIVVQVNHLDTTLSRPESAVELPSWTTDLAPEDDRRGYAFAWRPVTPPRVGDVGVDDVGNEVVVVGFGRHGFGGGSDLPDSDGLLHVKA